MILGALLALAAVGAAGLWAADGASDVHLTAKQALLLRGGNTLWLVERAGHPTFELRNPAGNVLRRFPSGSTLTRTGQGGVIVTHAGSSPVLVGLYERLVSAEKGEKLRQAQDAAEAAEAARRAREAAEALRNQAIKTGQVGKGTNVPGSTTSPGNRLNGQIPQPTDPSQNHQRSNKEQMNRLLHPSSPGLQVDQAGIAADGKDSDSDKVDIPEFPEHEIDEPEHETPEVHETHEKHEPVERPKKEGSCADLCREQPDMCHQCICRENPDDPKCGGNELQPSNGGVSGGQKLLPKGMRHHSTSGVRNPCEDCGDTRGGTTTHAPRLHVNLGDTPTSPRDGEKKRVPAGMGPDQLRRAAGKFCQGCPASGVSRTAGGSLGKGPSAGGSGAAPNATMMRTAAGVHLRPMHLMAGKNLRLRSGKTV
ncbi:MAG TPA: hypothetical protein VKA53_00485, partial [Thermoanaerobaculia bacterium]|nr:hypothetical protein [Thermoanaerobaculia bacterium]